MLVIAWTRIQLPEQRWQPWRSSESISFWIKSKEMGNRHAQCPLTSPIKLKILFFSFELPTVWAAKVSNFLFKTNFYFEKKIVCFENDGWNKESQGLLRIVQYSSRSTLKTKGKGNNICKSAPKTTQGAFPLNNVSVGWCNPKWARLAQPFLAIV